jgi:hypothetical protein
MGNVPSESQSAFGEADNHIDYDRGDEFERRPQFGRELRDHEYRRPLAFSDPR